MYCHWALHEDLDNSGTTAEFLKRVDTFIVNTIAGFQETGGYSMMDEHDLFLDFVCLQTFRSQLSSFPKSHSLPSDLCYDNPKWLSFLEHYAAVVEQGALSIDPNRKAKAITLDAVDKIVFRKGQKALGKKSHLPFEIQWDIFLKDGRICRIDLEADHDLRSFSHGLQVIPRRQ